MNRRILLTLFFTFMAFGSVLIAEQEFALKDLIQHSLRHNKELLNGTIDLSQAQSEILKSKSDLYPGISIGGQFLKNKLDDNSSLEADSSWKNSSAFQAEASYSIFYGGKFQKNRLAKAGKVGAELRVLMIESYLIDQVTQLYFQIQSLKETQKVIKQAFDLTHEQTLLIKLKVDQERGSTFDLLKSKVEEGKYRIELKDLEIELKTLKLELKKIVGLAQDKEVKLEDLTYKTQRNLELDSALKELLLNNRELASYENDLQIARINQKIAKEQYLPKVDLRASHSHNRIELGNDYSTQKEDQVGIYFSYDLFDGFSRRAEVEKTSLEIQKAKNLFLDKRDELTKRLHQAFQSIHLLEEMAGLAKENIDFSEREISLLKKSYESGRSSLFELIESHRTHYSLKIDLIKINNRIQLFQSKVFHLTGHYLKK